VLLHWWYEDAELRDANAAILHSSARIEATGEKRARSSVTGSPPSGMMPAERSIANVARFSAERQKAIDDLLNSARNNPDAPHP